MDSPIIDTKKVVAVLGILLVGGVGISLYTAPEFSKTEIADAKVGLVLSDVEETVFDDILKNEIPTFDLSEREAAQQAYLNVLNKVMAEQGNTLTKDEIDYLTGRTGQSHAIEERIKYLMHKKVQK